jgi:heme/copper-type cytochrome/quinol oxidase subunit 3
MTPRFARDLSGLPNHAFGPDSIVWWGTLGFMAIEGMGFLLALITYFCLMGGTPTWPPVGVAPPGLVYSSIMTAIFLVSTIPNHMSKKAAERQDLRGVLLTMGLVLLLEIVLVVVRGFELTTLNIRWDDNAYGSIVWTLLGLHTFHLLSDTGETIVVLAVLWLGDRDPRRFTDISENADYWYFVILAWLPIYAVIYLVPRLS